MPSAWSLRTGQYVASLAVTTRHRQEPVAFPKLWSSGRKRRAISTIGDTSTQRPPEQRLTIKIDGATVQTSDLAANGLDYDFGSHSVNVSYYADGASHTIEFEFDSDGTGYDGNVFVDGVTIQDSGIAERFVVPRQSSSGSPRPSEVSFHH
jgi:FlaG/FlaF family flagellin (archaellin)